MPPSSSRPWSTQYGQDFNKKAAGWRLSRRKPTPTNTSFKYQSRVPASTSLVPAQLHTNTYTGAYYGLDDTCGGVADGDVGLVDTDVVHNRGIHIVPLVQKGTKCYVNKEGYGTFLHQWDDMFSQTEPVIPEPTELPAENPQELHWICWPEQKTKRPHTSQGFAREVPGVNDIYPTTNDHSPAPGQPQSYEPAINGWTNAANDTERKTVENMYTTLQRSNSFYEPTARPMTSISINDPPVRDTYTLYGNNRQSQVDPKGVYKQSFFPYHQPGGAGVREDMIINGLAKSMEGREPNQFSHSFSFNKYPLHMRKNRKQTISQSQDYVHDQSMFQMTTPRCTGHFIIHPDWVSEKGGLRRSNTMIQPSRSRSRNDAFRY